MAEVAVERVVVKQLDAGIDVGSDGEQPRASYCTYAADRMRGFGGESHRAPLSDFVDYPDFAASYAKRFMSDDAMARQPAAIGDVVYEDLSGVDEEIDIFKSVLNSQDRQFADAFMTASSPGVMVLMMRNQHYPTEGDYIAALAPEIAKEYRRIVERDLVLQVDCPDLPAERLTNYVDVPFNEYLGIVERNIGELNRSLEGIPRERVRMHCCWGNYAGPHTRDPELRDLVSLLYEANVGTLVLPFANPRHQHEIDVFREFPLPDDVAVVVGVIDVTTNYVEHPKLIAKRLVAAAGSDRGSHTSNRRYGLRLRNVLGLRARRGRGRMAEAQGATGGRGPGQRTTLELMCSHPRDRRHQPSSARLRGGRRWAAFHNGGLTPQRRLAGTRGAIGVLQFGFSNGCEVRRDTSVAQATSRRLSEWPSRSALLQAPVKLAGDELAVRRIVQQLVLFDDGDTPAVERSSSAARQV